MTEPRRGTSTLVRRPTPKWVWLAVLLGALLIGALLWLLLSRNDGRPAAGVSPSPAASAATTPGGSGTAARSPGGSALSDISEITGASDRLALAGTRVDLTDLEVRTVTGDTTFWVGPSQEEQVFVVLEEDDSGGPVEGGVDVQEGQNVTLRGVIREMPSVDEAMRRWQLTADEISTLDGEDVFIRAQRVEVSE